MSRNVSAIDLPGAPRAYYAPATVSSSGYTLQVSGQVGTTTDGIAPTSYESQIHLALLNLKKVLFQAGAKVSDITKLTIYIVNYNPKKRLHTRHVQKWLGTHRPAMTLVPVTKLAMPDWLVEVDAVATYNPLPSHLSQPVGALAAFGNGQQVDVVVVGAGLSGLAAARDVIRAGLTCIVLEARDRVGGRTWSEHLDGGGVIDKGAAWINDSNQSRMAALAKHYGAELIEQNTNGNCVFQDEDASYKTFAYGELPPFNEKTRQNLAEVRDMVEAHCQKIDTFDPKDSPVDGLTFKAYLEQHDASPLAIATASVWTRAMLGQEPEDISALFFLNYCKSGGGLLQMRSDRKHGAQYLRVRQGTQLFARGLASSLPPKTVFLSTPVTSIHQFANGHGVEVAAGNLKLHAKKVILSVPTPVYKTINFSPPLPYAKYVLANSTNYGYYTKAMLMFRRPFWIENGFCGLAQSLLGPASVVRDTSSPVDNKHVLTCFMASDLGRAWSLLPGEEQSQVLLNQVAGLFNGANSVEKEFIGIVSHEWTEEQYSGFGCPCAAMPPGVLDSVGSSLREVFGGIHFVGTETAGEWKGYMEGAVRSGERGASEVLNSLKGHVAKI